MKKILIAILLLVPLLIIFTLNVSSTIVSAQIEYGVEHLVLKHLGENVDYVVIDLEEYVKTNKQYLLFPEFTPSNASNKEIEWSVSDASMAQIHKSGNGCAVSFIKGRYGTVDVIATSKSDTSKSAVCSFYITGKVIGRIDFYDYNTLDEIDSLTIKLNESTCIEARPQPFAAMKDKKIVWSSSDESVVKVNQNGAMKGVGQGKATITASITDEGGTVTNRLSVTVSGKSMSSESTIYTTSRSYDISSLLSNEKIKITSVENGTWEDLVVTIDEKADHAFVTLTDSNIEERVKICLVERNSLVIDYLYDYERTIWQNRHFVPLGTEYFAISASCPFTKAENIVWTSDNPSVATVVNGRIAGLKEGFAVLTASAEGFEPVSVEVVITPKIGDVRLELDELGDVAGLNEERVFGLYTCSYDGKEFTVSDSLQMRISYVYPVEIMQSENVYDYFYFESSANDLISIGENGYITFSREAIGKEIEVTVRARFSENNASDSYVFKVVEGINIGYDVPRVHYDKTVNTEMPNFYPAFEYEYLMNTYTDDFDRNGVMGAIVFQNNLYAPTPDVMGWWIQINRPIYGNGYTIDSQLSNTQYDSRIFGSGLNYERLVKYFGNHSELVVENLFIQAYSPVSDESDEAFKELKERGGIPFRQSDSDDPDIEIGITFRYCMFRYAYSHVNVAGGPVTFDGCIFSNSAGPAILHQSSGYRPSKVVIRNCIFSNTIAPIYLSSTGDPTSEDRNLNELYIDLRLEGENYVYNWKHLDEVSLDIFPQYDNAMLNSLISALNNKIAELFKLVTKDPKNSALIYHGVSDDYMNFGFVAVGVWRDSKIAANPDVPESEYGVTTSAYIYDENYYTMNYLNMDKIADFVNNNLVLKPICDAYKVDFDKNKSYIISTVGKKGVYNTKPGDTYQLNKETKDKLHGVGVSGYLE